MKRNENVPYHADEMALIPILPEGSEGNEKTRSGLPLAAALFVLLLSVIAAVIMISGAEKEVEVILPELTPPNESTEEWNGAFASREVYEKCLAASVRVEWSIGEETLCRSGAVISDNGWIATASDGVDIRRCGRAYVTLADGAKYSVDGIMRAEGGLLLLKISAAELAYTEPRIENGVVGESIISVAADGEERDVVRGEIVSTWKQGCKLNLSLSDAGIGAPVFDNEGRMLGVACHRDGENGNFVIADTVEESCLLKLKDDEAQ